MGYKRIFTKTPQLTLGIESGGEPPIINRQSFFIRLAQQSETLRRELIEASVFGHTGSQIQQKVEDQAAVNVATFAFEFFDEDGNQVGTSYFFGHQDERKIQEPFFF